MQYQPKQKKIVYLNNLSQKKLTLKKNYLMQTILGAGGSIATHLAKTISQYTSKIRLVSRNPQKVNETDELLAANLLQPQEINNAIKGSEIVYVTIGFPYSYKFWKENWPTFMSHVIEACIQHGSKLVFFDNIYMYDPMQLNGMTEESAINPPSKKGLVRAQVAKLIMDKVKEGKLTALIARSADFYGPGIRQNSMLTQTVFDRLSKGKAAQWMMSVNVKHSFTYTPDAGKATAILGNTPDAYNQVWHLPTASNPLSGKEWIETVATEFGVKPKYQVMGMFLLKVAALFVPFMREFPEMMYQYDRDYDFNSQKFEKHFDFKPTPYITGIKEIIKADYTK